MWCVLDDERSSVNAALSLIFRETPEEIAEELIERCDLIGDIYMSDYEEYGINTIEDIANAIAQYQDLDEEWPEDEDVDDVRLIIDEIDCYPDDYIKLLHPDGPIEEAISNFHFEFGDCTEDTSAAANGYEAFVVAFNEYVKKISALSDWRMVPGIPEEEVYWEALDKEIRSITGQEGWLTPEEEEHLKYLRKEE